MAKVIPFVVFVAALVAQCPSSGHRSAESVNSQPKDKIEKKECDFSHITPLGPRANYGSQLLSMPQPVYPEDLKQRGIKGRVSALLLVNVHTGMVEQACIKDGDSALADSAREAALKVKFAPYNSYVQKKYFYTQEIVTYNFEPK